MDEHEDLNIPRLRRILHHEGGIFNRSDTKKQLIDKIVKNRNIYRYTLVDLPRELLNVIGENLDIQDISDLCISNKLIRSKCTNHLFWGDYFTKAYNNNLLAVQENFTKLLKRLSAYGDMDLFNYLWVTPILVNGRDFIIKERGNLFIGYKYCIINKHYSMANMIYNMNSEFVERRIIRDLQMDNDDSKTYLGDEGKKWFELKLKYMYRFNNSYDKFKKNYIVHLYFQMLVYGVIY